MYKRFLIKYFLILLFSVLIFSFSFIVKADTINNNDNNDLQLVKESPIAILFECSTGKVIYEKNAHTKHPPASMTKIMTMLLVLEAIDNKIIKWDSVLSASQNAVSMGGSQIFLEVGEKMTVDDLFKALAIASANDAAVVLGEAVAGSLDEFVKKMNKKALDLGLKNTNFVNCNGLPDLNHYSTAYDIGILSCYLINKYGDSVLKYTSIYEDYLRKGTKDQFWLVNTNKLVKLYPEIDGLKTGYCSSSKYCLSATCKKENTRFVSVVMGAATIEQRNSDTLTMLNYANNNYEVATIYKKGYVVSSINDITKIPHDYDLILSDNINILKRKNEELNIKTIVEDNKFKVYHNNLFISECEIIKSCEVKKANLFQIILEIIKKILIYS